MPLARLLRPLLVAALVMVLAPAAMAATAAPSATTGSARDIAPQSATLRGTLNPQGHQTSWFFDYGTSTSYGQHTASTPAGAGTKSVAVSVPVGGLLPQTKYHFRLVAYSTGGTTRGADRTFTTPQLPVTFTLAATPSPVTFGDPVTLSGTVANEPAGTQVVLQRNPFPYTGGFTNLGNAQATDAAGNFAFPVLDMQQTAQFRVRTTTNRKATSGVITVPVAVRVSIHVKVRRHARRAATVRFTGGVTPAHDGAQLAIQKLARGRWVTIRGGSTHHRTGPSSVYGKTLHLHHGGTFRVFVAIVDGDHATGISRALHVRVR